MAKNLAAKSTLYICLDRKASSQEGTDDIGTQAYQALVITLPAIGKRLTNGW